MPSSCSQCTHRVNPQVLEVGREALVEPEVRPPGGGDEVAEPLVGELMGHHHRHPLLVGARGHQGVEQHRGLPVTLHVHYTTITSLLLHYYATTARRCLLALEDTRGSNSIAVSL